MRTILLFALILLGSFPACRSQEYRLPDEIPLFENLQDTAWDVENFGLRDRFYPIGVAGNGGLAYVIEPADEARGAYAMCLSIADADSTEGRALWCYDELEHGEGDPAAPKDLVSVWRKFGDTLSMILKAHGVEPGEGFIVERGTAFTVDGIDCAVSTTEKRRQEDWNYFDAITDLDVMLECEDGQRCVIDSMTEHGFPTMLEAEALGLLQSADEEDRYVVLKTVQRGWEGPPNVYGFRLIPLGRCEPR